MHLFLVVAVVLSGSVVTDSFDFGQGTTSKPRQGDLDSVLQSFYEKIVKGIDDRMKSYHYQSEHIEGECESSTEVCDCSEVKSMGYTRSGVYRVYVVIDQKRHYADAYCDLNTTSGNWIVFQRRQDGCIEFYRRWCEYAAGFGNPRSEYWLGNEFLHLLTSKRNYRLRVDLEDWSGNTRFAEYSIFTLGSSANKYILSLGAYSGTAGDSLSAHSGTPFSTQDSDNDLWADGNCAVRHHGGWWYTACHASNLNAIYYRGGTYVSTYADGITWGAWLGHQYSYKTTEMKLSPVV